MGTPHVTSSTRGMIKRLLGPIIACGLLVGCFERRCGPHQELTEGFCQCEDGRKLDDQQNCVKEAPAAPPKETSDASVDGMAPMAMAGGCDMSTGLGCSCTGDADCAGFDADYCVIADPADPEQKRVCLFQGCDKPGKECPTGLQCCAFPFAPQKTVCLPEVVDNMDYKCPF